MPTYRSFRAGLIAATLMLGAACANADDGQAVHRCAGRHGEIVFSGTPCSAGTALGARAQIAPSQPDARNCPTSREQLVEHVADAIGRSDVNMLAGLLRWSGIGARAADERLRVLRELVARPLLAIERDGSDAGSSGSHDDVAYHVERFHVRTGGGDAGGMREHVFGVDIDAGCHWLAW